MERKIRGKLPATILAALMLIPQSVMTAGAADDPTPVFTHEKEVTVSNGTDAVDASSVVGTMSASSDVTVNLTFTATGSGVQSLFFMGDSSTANNYIAVYLNGTSLGVESRNATGGYQLRDSFSLGSDVNLAKQHTLTFTISANTSYGFYLDGKEVKSGTAGCAFNSNLTTSDYIGFGKGVRSSNSNAYPLTGTLSEIELYNAALTDEQIMSYHNGELEDVVYSHDSVYYPLGTESGAYVTESDIAAITALEQGGVSVRYRVAEVVNDPQMLLSLSNSSLNNEYLGLYINPSTNIIGFDAQGGSSSMFSGKTIDLKRDTYADLGVSINDTNWHTITVTKDENILRFYVDGVYVDRYSNLGSGFFNHVTTPDVLGIGKAARSSLDNMELTGAVDSVTIYSSVLSDAEIARADSVTQWIAEEELDMTDAYKSETENLFYSGYEGSSAYRIPSLLTTKDGTQLAFIDKRNSHSGDYGNIDAVVRRKAAGESTFADPITLIDLPNNGGSAAFAIDMVTVQEEESGRIFAFVDMFPESTGLMNTGLLTAGVGYEEVDGEMCQILYDNSTSSDKVKFGHIRNVGEDGIGHVLDLDGEDTGYTVIVNPSEAGASLSEKGNLYKDGEYKGSIYMLNNGPDKGELCVLNTSYLWLVTSDDDGLTWSDPVDITPQVKDDWCLFFGTGPGVGIQLHAGDNAGRLVVPIYTANASVGSSQSSAVIYSDDKGETWHLGDSPQTVRGLDRATMNSGGMLTESQAVQLDNGNVLLFMRNNYSGQVQMATSTDGGETWDSITSTGLTDVYCQLTVIHYTKPNGEEYVLLCNPSGPGRKNGMLYLGQVQSNGSISWDYQRQVDNADEGFAYSCLTLTDDTTNNPKFAIMYEDQTSGIILRYFEFDENYIKAGMTTPGEMDVPTLASADVQVEGSTATISLTFDQTIMAVGNPRLLLELGGETATADYVSGSGTDTIVFTAEMVQANGILKATGLNLDAGLLENIQNKHPELSDIDLYANTDIDLANAEVTYTTQHSNSTAEGADGAAVNVIDGNPNTYWHSTWGQQSQGIQLPQSVTLNLEEVKTIYKVDYLARQNGQSGRILEYGIEVSIDGVDYTEVAHGTLASTTEWQEIEFIPVEAQYVRFVGYEAYSSGTESCAIAELKLHEYSDGVIEQGDETVLNNLVSAADNLTAENYSAVTWEAYETALAAARTVLAAAEPVSQNLIDRTAENLKDAQDALIDISRAANRFAAIKADEDKYTPASWAVLEAWMTEHEQELADAATSKDVTDMIVALAYQSGQLVEKVDKTALQGLLTDYTVTNPLTEDDYEPNSWSKYQTAITEAQRVMDDDNVSVQDVTDAITKLTDARTELKTDMTELQTLYSTYSALNEADYLPEEWLTMAQALTDANALLTAGTASPSDVRNAIQALNEAYADLKARPSATGLKTVYDFLKEELPDLSIYMNEGAQKMAKAFEDAEAVLADPRTEAQIQEQINALNAAYEELILKADNEQIQNLTGLQESLTQKDISGLDETQRQQVQTVLEKLQAALTADEISRTDAEALLQEASAALSLTGETGQPGNPSGNDPSGSNLSGSSSTGQNLSSTDTKTNTTDKSTAVKTGDTAEIGWIILMLTVGMTAAAAVVIRRQSGKE